MYFGGELLHDSVILFFEFFLDDIYLGFICFFGVFEDRIFFFEFSIKKSFLFLQLNFNIFMMFFDDLQLSIFLSHFFYIVIPH